MSSNFLCEIVTSERAVFSGMVSKLIVPGVMGEMGILAGHSPLLSQLTPGVLRFEAMDENLSEHDSIFYISGGFIEVQPSVSTVMAETVIRSHELDEVAAFEAKRHAQELIAQPTKDMDYSRAIAQLSEAIAQLRAIQQLREKIGRR